MALLKNKEVAVEPVESTELCIPVGTVFKGEIQTNANARIFGVVEGNITACEGNVYFGADGKGVGDVSGNHVAVGGELKGDIAATGRVRVLTGACVRGNIAAGALVVEQGASFEGRVTIGVNQSAPCDVAEGNTNAGEREDANQPGPYGGGEEAGENDPPNP